MIGGSEAEAALIKLIEAKSNDITAKYIVAAASRALADMRKKN